MNEISIGLPPDQVFGAVSTVEQIAPCLPGARLEGRDGDDYLGMMNMKVGAITVEYQGKLWFERLDAEARQATMCAMATESNGQGGVEATIAIAVTPEADGSRIELETDLDVRGRVAQFGRGALEKISQRLMTQFATNLERQLRGSDEPAPGVPVRKDLRWQT